MTYCIGYVNRSDFTTEKLFIKSWDEHNLALMWVSFTNRVSVTN